MGDLGIGVIGTGAGVRTHIPVWSRTAGARVTAICSHAADRAAAVAEQFGLDHAVTDYDELARLDDVDLVVVATTPDLHHAATMAAIRAGKHVLCEKPFAMNGAEALEMLDAARASGVRHFVNHEFRMDPALQEMQRRVTNGDIGRITYLHLADFGNFVTSTQGILSRWWFQEDKGGGWFGAHGSHRVDQLRFLLGEIAEISATLETVIAEPQRRSGTLVSEVDDSYFLSLRFASGAFGVCVDGAATAVPVSDERLEVYGTDGTLTIDGGRLYAAAANEPLHEVPVPEPVIEGLEGRGEVLHGLLNRAIVDAIRSGEPLHPDFEDGYREQLVMDAGRRSHRERRWVPVVS
jgi:predicted dehydrogenase